MSGPKGIYAERRKRPWSPFKGMCRHCGKVAISRPRRLCWVCHREHRHLYALACYRSEVVDRFGGYALPPSPTDALPGTPEKVAVIEERARLGLRLWHPGDARRETA